MKGFNQVILVGHVGRDPEINHYGENSVRCNFSLAVTEKWRDKDGQTKEDTTWVPVSTWNGKLIESVITPYVGKGSAIMVIGKLRIKDYEDNEGNKRKHTEVLMSNLNLLSFKEGNGQVSSPAPKQQSDKGYYPPPPEEDIPF